MNKTEEKIVVPGSPNGKKKAPVQKISFAEIISDYQVDSPSSLVNYLAQIWRDLAKRSNEKKKGINKITFAKYYELPGLISERLFNVLDSNRDDYLNSSEFINGMIILFTNSYANLTKFIFHFYDFDHDGVISREDVRVVLSYVPLQSSINKDKDDFAERVVSQDELFEIIKTAFREEETMKLDEFIYIIENINSDIFVFLLVYILDRRPFNNATLKLFDAMNKDVILPSEDTTVEQKIATPSVHSSFSSPSLIKIQQHLDKKENPINLYSVKEVEEVVDNIGYNSEIRVGRGRSRTGAVDEKGNKIIKEIEPVRKERKMLTNIQEHNKYKISTDEQDKIYEDEDSIDFSEEDNDDEMSNEITNKSSNIASYEGYLLKINSEQEIKKIWFRLVNKDIYFYDSKYDAVHKGMHNLSGVYINENTPFEFNDKVYYSFSMIFPKKKRTYYCDNEKEFITWMKKLKQAINFKNIDDLYEVKEEIGKGRFGMVCKGKNKATGRIVAIKSMDKKEMRIEDLELVKTEMDVLKISQHPNIIKLYDIFENEDFIYIIMEYCGGGDLFSYIKKRGFKLQEERACEIIHKICVAVYFMHSYGIIHRDLKPENILMTDSTDHADIRLLDFGLSKIIGPGEKCAEPFGTISYAAPELLQGKCYDKAVDSWSIGIITYLLLIGVLPFDDENDDNEIVRQTIYDPVPFYSKQWKTVSPEAKAFVDGLLQKDPQKRMSIKGALEHEWLNMYNKLAGVRKESKDTSCTFEIYVSTNANLKPKQEAGKNSC